MQYTLPGRQKTKKWRTTEDTDGKHGTQSRWWKVPYWKLGKYKEVDHRPRSGKHEA